MRNLQYENKFDLQENKTVSGTHFQMNGHEWFHTKTRFDTEAKGKPKMTDPRDSLAKS